MDWLKTKTGIVSLFHKYKYVALVVLAGIVLMLIPSGKKNEATPTQATQNLQAEEISLETRLQSLLSNIKGAGRVEVMLTERVGEEIIYQINANTSTNDNGNQQRTDTVLITDTNRNQSGLISQIRPPVYLGAVILCQGADDPVVKLAIVDAVSKATGLNSDKISVIKMK